MSTTYGKTVLMRGLLAGALVVTPRFVMAQQTPLMPEPVIVVGGEGLVQAVPDRAWLTVSAESRAASAKEAQRRNTEAMTPLLAKLKAAGIPDEAIRTSGYDVQQEWDYVNNRRISKGFVARNAVEVRVDNVDKVGEYLELAGSSGATSLGGIRFDLKNRSSLERDALRLAVRDARAKADAIASGAGRAADRIVRIDEQGVSGGIPPPMPMAYRTLAAPKEAADVPISAGQIEIRANVTLTMTMK